MTVTGKILVSVFALVALAGTLVMSKSHMRHVAFADANGPSVSSFRCPPWIGTCRPPETGTTGANTSGAGN